MNRDLERGELLALLRETSQVRFRPPGSDLTRSYALPTLLRWNRAFRSSGLEGLRPAPRTLGDALGVDEECRELLLEIRRQHPSTPASNILVTLEDDGVIVRGSVSAQTLRRLYRRHGLSRRGKLKGGVESGRYRWEAKYPGDLWHADVCHGPTLVVGDRRIPVRIHAILDDSSRYVVALRVHSHEREVAMLDLVLEAVRSYGASRRLYLDNGATYRGFALGTACGRLDVTLRHAGPYDPQARGKMERFWRTLREGVLDDMGPQNSLHDVQVRLSAWLSERYHHRPHAGLKGLTPAKAWTTRKLTVRSESELRDAMTVRETRRVRGDCTLSVGNIDWEIREGFLAGRVVTVARALSHPESAPWVEHEEQRYPLSPVDPIANGERRKRRKPKPGLNAVDYDPATVVLDKALSRGPRRDKGAK
ncbi:MAG: DDE-type integrase/transposase/recombinase [Planctomycetes bacterium]|nr:DDE-type integrase/transposase/recombinase [Planctomycetota bacterium]